MQIRFLWRSKFKIARVALAMGILWVLLEDRPAWRARLELAALPQLDYLSEGQGRLHQGDYAEALAVVDAGLEACGADQDAALCTLREQIVAERDDYHRKLAEFFKGAALGHSDSLEGLLGAVAADFFIVGDIRDLVIQGARWAVDGECDEFLALLSALGVATTLLPSADGAVAVMKRGAASPHSSTLVQELRAIGKTDPGRAADCLSGLARLTRRLGPQGALRMASYGLSPDELARLSRRVDDLPDAAFLLSSTRGTGARRLLTASSDAELATLRAAARAGPRGERWLAKAGAAFRPHPLIGAAKALWKGAPPALLRALAERLDAYSGWLLAAAATWLLLEFSGFRRRGATAIRRAAIWGADPYRTTLGNSVDNE